MSSFIVGADHPYWKFADPQIVLSARGVWRVIWRDFFSIRHDEEFKTEAKAEAHAAMIRREIKPPLAIFLSEHCVEDVEIADQFWRDARAPVELVVSNELPPPVSKMLAYMPAGTGSKLRPAFEAAQGDSPIERIFSTALWCSCQVRRVPFWPLGQKDGKHGPQASADTAALCLGAQVWVFAWPVDFVLWAHDGRLWRRLLIECDGHRYHALNKEQIARDRERDRQAQLSGLTLLRFTGSEIWGDPMGCASQVLRWVDGLKEKSGAA